MNRGKLEIVINKHSLYKKKLSILIDKFYNEVCDLPSEIKRQPHSVSEGIMILHITRVGILGLTVI